MKPPSPLVLVLAAALAACTPSYTPAPLETPCTVEVHNETDRVLRVTAFGREKLDVGTVDPGRHVEFQELCRVERVPVRGQPTGADVDPVWVVAVLRAGKVARVRLES